MDFLLCLGLEVDAKAVLEKALTTVPADELKPIYDRFCQVEWATSLSLHKVAQVRSTVELLAAPVRLPSVMESTAVPSASPLPW